MIADTPESEKWLTHEDRSCFEARAARLTWLASRSPSASIWMFHGGWLAKALFEEARYCFVYGQVLASAILSFAFVEKTLAAMFYASGRNDLQRASAEQLIAEAHSVGWITEEESLALDRARQLRNPLVHFRKPLHPEQPESRVVEAEAEPYEIVESDAKHILEAMFRVVERNAAA